jgi:hypothetical protein
MEFVCLLIKCSFEFQFLMFNSSTILDHSGKKWAPIISASERGAHASHLRVKEAFPVLWFFWFALPEFGGSDNGTRFNIDNSTSIKTT